MKGAINPSPSFPVRTSRARNREVHSFKGSTWSQLGNRGSSQGQQKVGMRDMSAPRNVGLC